MRQVIGLAVLFAAIVCCGTSALAGEVVFKDLKGRTFTEPRQQIGFSVGYRTDERSYTSSNPQFTLQFLHFLAPALALKADLGFTDRTKFGDGSHARSYSYGAGFRFQRPEKLITPWGELGLVIHTYQASSVGNSSSYSRTGVLGRAGFSFRLSNNSQIDLGAEHVLNSTSDYTLADSGPMPPAPGHLPCCGTSAVSDKLFNPTHVFVRYRFGL